MVGCSDSLLRNTEYGIVKPLSDKLLERIERVTGVSAAWLSDASARWCKGDHIGEERIPDAQGGDWRPLVDHTVSFADDFTDAVEQLYFSSPETLPAFMGAVLEAYLETVVPPTRESISGKDFVRKIRSYFAASIMPTIRMVADLPEEGRQEFFQRLCASISARENHSELRTLWKALHVGEGKSIRLIKDPRISPRSRRASSDEARTDDHR